MSRKRPFSSSLSRRSLVQRGSALGAGAAVGKVALGSAQTPAGSPAASPVPLTEVDQDFLAAQEAVIAEIQEMGEGKTLHILSAVVGGKTPEEDQLFEEEIKRLTGIQVELVHPTAEYDEKMLADLAAGVEYDLIYMNKNRMDVLVDQEVLTDLTEQINNSAILSNPTVIPPEEWELIKYEGDTFYSVFNKFEGARMLTVRQDWLDQLGLEAPRTLDEIYDVMVAFRDQDPAGNGEGVTLGLSTAGTYDIQPFMSSEGIRPGYVEVDGKRTIPYATEAAIPVYEWLAKLYSEGLYDPSFATAETADMRNLFMTDKVGFVTYWDTWVGLFNALVEQENPGSDFQAKGLAAAEGPEGVIISRGQPSVWAIPVNAPNAELAFKFLEWWHTFPGIILGSLGILDHDYTVEGETYELTEVGAEHAMDHGVPTPYNTNWNNPVGELPGLAEAQEISVEYGYLAQLGPQWDAEVVPILDENIIKAILGDISAADAVAAMQERLTSEGLID